MTFPAYGDVESDWLGSATPGAGSERGIVALPDVGDRVLVVFPHEACPVDGTVVEGHGTMDESYLTGEPYLMSKAPGAPVLSGALNGDTALTIVAGPLNYVGANPKVNCRIDTPQPSS